MLVAMMMMSAKQFNLIVTQHRYRRRGRRAKGGGAKIPKVCQAEQLKLIKVDYKSKCELIKLCDHFP
jgi:hypothetical protein